MKMLCSDFPPFACLLYAVLLYAGSSMRITRRNCSDLCNTMLDPTHKWLGSEVFGIYICCGLLKFKDAVWKIQTEFWSKTFR